MRVVLALSSPAYACCLAFPWGLRAWNEGGGRQSHLVNAFMHCDLLSRDDAEAAMASYVHTLTEEYFQWMAGKFGMVKYDPEMGLQYMQLMARHRADFTLSFRLLSELPSLAESFELSDAQLVEVLEPALPPDASGSWIPEWGAWVRRYLVVVEEGLAEAELSDEERRCRMDSHNPLYIPRNYLLQVAIEATEKGNHAPLLELLQVLKTPYVAQDGMHAYAHPAPDWARKAEVMQHCAGVM
ncbi:hypothetical protein CYMTET_24955 [Cymbomonas tetramitiformis]|uniref:Selenoprotein O n=1 Tax=Cymbomonas tetramitiformis TaxID=36881 RepID=A0AAE0KZN5_9CHLO|nr:hypothetical protein CYMTET_24955 [Cymbomonas tetramitiformis]